jgi:hypothetical protein
MSQLSTVAPNVYVDEHRTITVNDILALKVMISKVQTLYVYPYCKIIPTVSSVSQTRITESEASFGQQITAQPLTRLTLQRSSTKLGPYSELYNDTTSHISLTSQ